MWRLHGFPVSVWVLSMQSGLLTQSKNGRKWMGWRGKLTLLNQVRLQRIENVKRWRVYGSGGAWVDHFAPGC